MPSRRAAERSWDVLLIGGAAGGGKTTIAHRLARHFRVTVTAVDDFQVILERMTTPEHLPELHFWRTHPDPESLPPEAIARQGLDILRVMAPALEAVIADRLESGGATVMEGDFIAPELVMRPAFEGQPNEGRVRGVFLYEPQQERIIQNFATREPAAGRQSKRARVSWLQGQWFVKECDRLGVPALPARPWRTLFSRVVDAVG